MDLLPVPVSDTRAYINYVKEIPSIPFEKEVELFNRYQSSGSADALRSLLLPNLKHPVYVAFDYNQSKFDIGELIQEGNVGLMQAVKNFDPDKGFKFATLANHYIKGTINAFVRRNYDTIGFNESKGIRKVYNNIRKFHDVNTVLTDEKRDEIAKELNVDPCHVEHVAERLLNSVHSLDTTMADGDNDTLADHVEDENSNFAAKFEENSEKQSVLECLDVLNEREKYVLESFYSDTDRKTLRELAKELGVSGERVRQLRVQAEERVRQRAMELELI